jgi:hypothetical protein
MSCACDMNGRGNACHCRACCLTFSGLTAFDHHILHGEHQPPAARGLAQVRPGVWGFPATDAERERLRILRAERDQAKVTG